MRKSVGSEEGVYYICMFAHTPSSFSFQVSEEQDQSPDYYKVIQTGYNYHSTLKAQSKQVAILQVPSLDFSDEDFKLLFQIEMNQTLTGMPDVLVRFCNKYQKAEKQKESEEQCANEVVKLSADELIRRSRSNNDDKVFKWRQGVQLPNSTTLSLEIDHNESLCEQKQPNIKPQCYYQIAILSNIALDTEYTLTVSKIQNNYQQLKTRRPVVQQVEKDQVRYFKYQFHAPQKGTVVSVQLQTLHGDADVFISQKNHFPNSNFSSEFSSVSSKEVDRVDIKTSKLTEGPIYIGVFGYQKSTFKIEIRLQYTDSEEGYLEETVTFGRDYFLLTEGKEIEGDIHNEDENKKYRFSVNMEEGFEKDIVIQLSQIGFNRAKILIQFGQQPVDGGSNLVEEVIHGTQEIRFKVGSNEHHSQGTYFMLVLPIYNWIQKFLLDDWYKFSLRYFLDGDFYMLDQGKVHRSSVVQTKVKVFRLILENQEVTQTRFRMAMEQGEAVIKVGFDENNVREISETNNNGKAAAKINSVAIDLPQEELIKNPNCQSQQGVCILYIAVLCLNQDKVCHFSLKSSSSQIGPQQLTIGQPIVDLVEENGVTQYYFSVNQKHVEKNQPFFIILNCHYGDADLYVSVEQGSNFRPPEQWDVVKKQPQVDFDFKSVESFTQDLIKIPHTFMKECIEKTKQLPAYKDSDQSDDVECAVVVFVVGKPMSLFSEFELVAYLNIQNLPDEASIEGLVEENQMQYFVYEVKCDNCSLVIGVQPLGEGDPDLFVNFGQKRLPDRQSFDFESATERGEQLQIDINHDYFKNNKIQSMKGTYTIGVYGNKKSKFVISASQSQKPIIPITLGIPIVQRQGPYVTNIFRVSLSSPLNNYYTKRLRVSIEVSEGKADLYLNNYNEDFDQNQNINDRLPLSQRQSIESLLNLSPLSLPGERQIEFGEGSNSFCSDCTYLIGIHSHSENTGYELKVTEIDDSDGESYFLKMGKQVTKTLKSQEIVVFKVIPDYREDLKIEQTNSKGNTTTQMSLGSQTDKVIDQFKDSGVLTLQKFNPSLKVGEIYSISVENNGNQEAEISLVASQKTNIIQLQQGQPLVVQFERIDDVARHFYLSLPQGPSTLTIQIQPDPDNFYKFQPSLFYKVVDEFSSKKGKIYFPPNGDSGFFYKNKYEWYGFLQVSKSLNVPSDSDSAAVFSIYMKPQWRDLKDRGPHKVTVFASTSKETLLKPDKVSIQTIYQNQQIQYIRLNSADFQNSTEQTPLKKGYLGVEIQSCMGKQSFNFKKSLDDQNNQVSIQKVERLRGKTFYWINTPLPAEGIYIVVQSLSLSDLPFNDGEGQRGQFLITARSGEENKIRETYIRPETPEIDYWKHSDLAIMLKWKKLQNFSSPSQPQELGYKVKYHVVKSTNKLVNLDTTCALNSDFALQNQIEEYQTEDDWFVLSLEKGIVTKVNVIAQVDQAILSNYMFPYQDFELALNQPVPPTSPKSKHILFVVSFILLAVVAGIALIGYRARNRDTILGRFVQVVCAIPSKFLDPRGRAERRKQRELGQYVQATQSSVDYNPPAVYETEEQ